MEKLLKEVEVRVEGKPPTYFQLLPILQESQAMAVQRFGSVALAVYRLPNKYHDGTPPEA